MYQNNNDQIGFMPAAHKTRCYKQIAQKLRSYKSCADPKTGSASTALL
jgi:hypothetical protein